MKYELGINWKHAEDKVDGHPRRTEYIVVTPIVHGEQSEIERLMLALPWGITEWMSGNAYEIRTSHNWQTMDYTLEEPVTTEFPIPSEYLLQRCHAEIEGIQNEARGRAQRDMLDLADQLHTFITTITPAEYLEKGDSPLTKGLLGHSLDLTIRVKAALNYLETTPLCEQFDAWREELMQLTDAMKIDTLEKFIETYDPATVPPHALLQLESSGLVEHIHRSCRLLTRVIDTINSAGREDLIGLWNDWNLRYNQHRLAAAAAENEAEQQKEKDKEKYTQTWTAKNGSDRLVKQLAQGYDGWPLFLHEHLEKDFDGYLREVMLAKDLQEATVTINPTEISLEIAEALAHFLVVSKQEPDIETAHSHVLIVDDQDDNEQVIYTYYQPVDAQHKEDGWFFPYTIVVSG